MIKYKYLLEEIVWEFFLRVMLRKELSENWCFNLFTDLSIFKIAD